MCMSRSCPPSIFCIIPPYMLRGIVEHGSAQQRTAAIETILADQTLRQMRTEAAAHPVPPAPALGGEAEKRRSVYSANNQQTLPGVLAREEGSEPVSDVSVNEAYDGLGATYDLFWDQFSRNSIDDEGQPLSATVHFGRGYNNAFWNGEQMVFGDGDGKIFNRFTIAIDVIGHELAHGVTQDEVGLRYSLQPGALNESLSDVFGSLVKQYHLGQTAEQADWLIGAGLFTDQVQGAALRSMKAPGTAYDDPVLGKDPQPAHMDNFVRTFEDNGGVHINSGIPNRAFYLAAVALGGNAWEKAGHIWYETLRDSQLRANTGFLRFAGLTVRNARRLFGQGSDEQRAVASAWAQVGLRVAL
ncbi:MAG: peptidase M4 family protein [Chloroflexales bacterium]|nr:peptidase M4 family protein [Chloroflexales bacterium]